MGSECSDYKMVSTLVLKSLKLLPHLEIILQGTKSENLVKQPFGWFLHSGLANIWQQTHFSMHFTQCTRSQHLSHKVLTLPYRMLMIRNLPSRIDLASNIFFSPATFITSAKKTKLDTWSLKLSSPSFWSVRRGVSLPSFSFDVTASSL